MQCQKGLTRNVSRNLILTLENTYYSNTLFSCQSRDVTKRNEHLKMPRCLSGESIRPNSPVVNNPGVLRFVCAGIGNSFSLIFQEK